jgi:multidrug resistance protein, MATE family
VTNSNLMRELRVVTRLSLPLAATQVGMMLIGVVETLIVGRAGTHALGAVALGNLWLYGTVLVANGVVLGVDPLISQAHGAHDKRGVALAFQSGLLLSLLLSLPLGALWLMTEPALVAFGQDPELARDAGHFVKIQTPTASGFLIFTVTRQYLAGRGIVAPGVWVLIAGNLLNAAACWALVLGAFGAPRLGVVGAGLAAGFTRVFIAGALLAITFGFRLHRDAWVPWSRAAFSIRPLARILMIGLPIGFQYGLEVWAFQIGTLLAGRLGATELAAHTIVLNLAALSFMVPLGISMAASVRVGNLVGAGDRAGARTSAFASLGLGGGVMLGAALLFFFARHSLPALYAASPPVAAAAAGILPIAAAFQLFDGTQAVGGGVLRGLGRTRPAALFNLIGYYVVALPLAAWLALESGAGLAGVWIGLAVGLAAVALALVGWIAQASTFRAIERTAA